MVSIKYQESLENIILPKAKEIEFLLRKWAVPEICFSSEGGKPPQIKADVKLEKGISGQPDREFKTSLQDLLGSKIAFSVISEKTQQANSAGYSEITVPDPVVGPLQLTYCFVAIYGLSRLGK